MQFEEDAHHGCRSCTVTYNGDADFRRILYGHHGENCETAVEVLAALGIVEGKAEGAYEPDSSLTRAEMATIILRTMNMAEAAEGKAIFSDVPSSHWAYITRGGGCNYAPNFKFNISLVGVQTEKRKL